MNGVGTWYGSGPMESQFATLESELVHHCAYRSRDGARASICEYIETFYNRNRLRSLPSHVAPRTFEEALSAQGAG